MQLDEMKAKFEHALAVLQSEVQSAEIAAEDRPSDEFIAGMQHMVEVFENLVRTLRR